MSASGFSNETMVDASVLPMTQKATRLAPLGRVDDHVERSRLPNLRPPPAGMYGHVEPVIGIQSNHPLNDTTFYDDDVAVHFTDAGVSKVYRTISTLPCKWAGVNEKADCGDYSYRVGNPYGFRWAVRGFANDEKPYVPTSLHVQPWMSEPDM